MHVLIVSQYFWPESFIINDLAVGLRRRGHAVTVLTGLPNYPQGRIHAGYSWPGCRRQKFEGIDIIRVPLFARRNGRPRHLVMNYCSFVISACLLGPLLCRARYDLIFVFEPSPFTVGIPALVLRWIKKAPLLFWVQDLWPESLSATGAIQSGFLLAKVGWLVRFVYRRCDRILVQSPGFAGPATKQGANPEHIIYFPNWAEELYQAAGKSELPDPLARKFNGFSIVFAGNLGEAQSLDTIIQAAVRLKPSPEIQWIILGDGRHKAWLEEQIARLDLQSCVHLAGRYPAEVMPSCFARADLLLVTLKRDPVFALTIPSKVQAYLACGRPIAAALDGEGAKVIRESGAGLVADAEDSAALADAVMRLYRMNEEERKAMGANGRCYYNAHFKRDKLLGQLEKIMFQTLQEGPCAS
ncbi:MAG: glycosyltransferase family 4 protein [Methylococcaceae bacterium]|nr:glycosyltransferase family 4 protein [Methylococcaceae bacterium]